MTTVNYSIVKDEHGQSLTVFIDTEDTFETHTIPSTHVRFPDILDHLLLQQEEDYDVDWLRDNLDIVTSVGEVLETLSERVRVSGNTLLFDGDPIRGELATHIVSLVKSKDSNTLKPLVNFLEKVQTNPSKESIDSLYSWIENRNLTITDDGDFIAYKGVKLGEDGTSESIHSGRAVVNGVVYQGYIPNPDGAVVEMPRSKVQQDTSIGCASGLHAGTWQYAEGFARGRVLTVKINPRDVVSVPDDCQYQKLRVSRYTVLSTVTKEYLKPVWENIEDESYEYDDEDYWGDGDDDY